MLNKHNISVKLEEFKYLNLSPSPLFLTKILTSLYMDLQTTSIVFSAKLSRILTFRLQDVPLSQPVKWLLSAIIFEYFLGHK